MRHLFTAAFVCVAAGSAACASTGATPRPFPTPAAAATASPVVARGGSVAVASGPAVGYSVAGTALSLRGVRYRNGGADLAGFDCSGLVKYVYEQNGLAMPRTVSELFRVGREVQGSPFEPGDLVFFTTVSPGASHVGIAIGGDEFVHAPNSAGEVRVERMSAPYWVTRFVGARRVV
ncbi:MAG: NlpC/P60 family protein [Vicinamibacterales bacterium]